ncbi:MAG: hypothetical protein C3F08_10040 [Candidatus Methylomirabilota bacterium]|nr:MAG: hypothetical protein C3F08_10040 [candidate division NC10 bacterium]
MERANAEAMRTPAVSARPDTRTMTQKAREAAVAADCVASLARARSEATRRSTSVKSRSRTGCASSARMLSTSAS